MKNALNIVRKELDKIFRNPRLILSTFILPGLIIFLIYSFMGNSFSSEIEEINKQTSVVYVINKPTGLIENAEAVYKTFDENGILVDFKDYEENLDSVSSELEKTFNEKIENGEAQAYLFFEKDFINKMNDFHDQKITEAPKVMCYANSSLNASSAAYSKVQTIINLIKDIKVTELYGNTQVLTFNQVELASEKALSGQILSMLLPMLIMIFVFAGGISIGSDAIAGEKERGTIATLLMAPIKKEEIVLGKIISTVIITILSALGSFIGTAASLPNMGGMYGDATIANYDVLSYAQLLLIIILVALMASCLFLTASALAKSNKEATAYAMPIYILSMVIGVSTMFMDKVPTEVTPYLIPLYNLTLGIKAILLNQITTVNMLCITVSTIVYFVLVIILISKLFKNENLMFAK